MLPHPFFPFPRQFRFLPARRIIDLIHTYDTLEFETTALADRSPDATVLGGYAKKMLAELRSELIVREFEGVQPLRPVQA